MRYKKSTLLPATLFVYITVTMAYLLPKNDELTSDEKWYTAAVGYVIVLLLWFVLYKKEKLKQKNR